MSVTGDGSKASIGGGGVNKDTFSTGAGTPQTSQGVTGQPGVVQQAVDTVQVTHPLPVHALGLVNLTVTLIGYNLAKLRWPLTIDLSHKLPEDKLCFFQFWILFDQDLHQVAYKTLQSLRAFMWFLQPYVAQAQDAAAPYVAQAKDVAAPYVQKAQETAGPYVAQAQEVAAPYIAKAQELGSSAIENARPAVTQAGQIAAEKATQAYK